MPYLVGDAHTCYLIQTSRGMHACVPAPGKTYRDRPVRTVELCLLALKVLACVCGPYMLLLAFSYHENVRRSRAERNEISGRTQLMLDVFPADQTGQDQTSLEWLASTDPAAVRSRRKTMT
jgi:hypothetical protein